jgi:FkbM family methyltransferase
MNPTLKASLRWLLPKQYRPHQIMSGPLRGLRIVTSWNHYPSAILGYNEKALLKWLSATVRPGQTWLDVGAHYGYTALAMGKLVGTAGRVFTFEPTLTTAGCVSHTVSLNKLKQVTVVPLGLGAPATLELRRMATLFGMSDINVKDREDEVTIYVASFDWLWPQICGGNARIDGVKIDVQGMEIDVVRGMSTWLKAWKPKLAVELHPGVNREDLLTLLESCGYDRSALPIEPAGGETAPQFLDNRSYVFTAK